MEMEYKFVGKSFPKLDTMDKVIGNAAYTDDIEYPGMLYAKTLRSKHPHATIVSLDSSRAERLLGVKAIITAKDVPLNAHGYNFKDQVVFAQDKARYLGDPIVAVAAETEEIAEEALEYIDVEYKLLPAVFDPREALKSDAVKVHEGGNLRSHRKIRYGNVEEGFSISDELIEDMFSTQKVEHCHLEPHTGIAIFNDQEGLTIWTTCAMLFNVHSELARVLQIPSSKIRIIHTTCGGGFGGKNEVSLEPYIALLAMKTRRPVKMIWTREEEFIGSTIRHSYFMEYKTGVRRDGTLVAQEIKLISDNGAYTQLGESVLTKACIFATGPYRIPHVKIDGYLAYTNNTVGGAMRGFGVPQVSAAVESHIDHIAEVLGLDPLELRLRNALKSADLIPTGQMLHNVQLGETLSKASTAADWHSPYKNEMSASHIRRGRGMACMLYPIGFVEKPNPSTAVVKINPDGSAVVLVGSADMGQGSDTVLSQIAAEELGVPFESIAIVSGDTKVTFHCSGTVASRVTYTTGNAVRRAAAKAKNMLFEIAGEELSINIEALNVQDGWIYVKDTPEKRISVGTAAFISYQRKGEPVVTTASFNPKSSLLNPETGQGAPFSTYVTATQIAEVEVNLKTGLAKVLRIIAAHDVGKAINPQLVKGQITGGILMGLGQALMEDIILKEGHTANPNFTDYVIPTSIDTPEIEVILIEGNEPSGPFGAKGVGEAVNIATAPAILNAIYNAIGVRVRDLPATPERILLALKEVVR
jgi:nicotinate dehydrogenase large molybdopterin subunit